MSENTYKVIYKDLNGPDTKRKIRVAGIDFKNGVIVEVKDLKKLGIILKRKDMVLVDERDKNLAQVQKEGKPKTKPKPKPAVEEKPKPKTPEAT